MRFLLLLCLFLSTASLALAAEPATNPEITWLLQYMEKADVKFIRSGKEYTPKEGAEHLRAKLGKAGGKVKTAEDFIEGIASRSYLNGDEYLVKSADGKTRPTGPWLKEALARHRAQK
jgi:hypothetical protein